ncbi:MAG: VOC family protein [Pricia sp.]
MIIDHIFIFSDGNGEEANELVNFGFTEGSSRRHPGQGTINRKFYFQNFFLEVLWVIDEAEIQNEVTSKTKLWERSQFNKNEFSRYGLCLLNSISTDALFKNSKKYQPNYFPTGASIDFISNEQNPQLPWTFRLPYRDEKKVHNEPIKHSNGIKRLTQVIFEISSTSSENMLQKGYQNLKAIDFKESHRTHLTLEFDGQIQGKSKEFPQLGLSIKY